jgi:hypothetical protein
MLGNPFRSFGPDDHGHEIAGRDDPLQPSGDDMAGHSGVKRCARNFGRSGGIENLGDEIAAGDLPAERPGYSTRPAQGVESSCDAGTMEMPAGSTGPGKPATAPKRCRWRKNPAASRAAWASSSAAMPRISKVTA